ncbi:MAG: MFS transporter, partial [Mycobacteriales bacterium]
MSAQAAGDSATRGLGDPVVVRVLVAYVLARVPAAAVWLSIVLDVSRASGSYAAAGASVAAYGVGVALVAPFVGRAADRWGARAVLLAAAAVQLPALLLLAAAAHRAGAALLLPSFVAGAVQPPLIPCMRAGWALLVPDEAQRQACFAFDAVLGEVVDLAAPVIAVALSVARGRASSLVVVAVAVAVTTLAFAVVAPSARRPTEAGRPRALTRSVLAVLVVVLVLTAGLGAVEVAVVTLSDSAGHRFDAGVLLSLFTLGSIAGGLAHGRFHWATSARTQLLLLMVPLGTGLAAAAVLPHRTALTGVTLTLAGVTVAPLVAVLLGMLQEVAQEGATTETFTYATTANFLG